MIKKTIKVSLILFFRDLRKFKDAKKQFEKVSEEKENALVKNAQVQRNKQHEVEEATNILTATRKCFRHIALDYVLQVYLLHIFKKCFLNMSLFLSDCPEKN